TSRRRREAKGYGRGQGSPEGRGYSHGPASARNRAGGRAFSGERRRRSPGGLGTAAAARPLLRARGCETGGPRPRSRGAEATGRRARVFQGPRTRERGVLARRARARPGGRNRRARQPVRLSGGGSNSGAGRAALARSDRSRDRLVPPLPKGE